MSIVFLTGSHPRHAYMAGCVAATGLLSALVIEAREEHVPQPPAGLSRAEAGLFKRHFAERAEAERHFFGDEVVWPDAPVLNVDCEGLNGSKTVAFVDAAAPAVLLSYGVHKLNVPFLSSFAGAHLWNIHGGLSPWYRGVITHFWPSYLLEPQMTGMTVHELTQDIDGGGVMHQSVAPLVAGDGLHQLACRAVRSLGNELPELLRRAAHNQLQPPHPQKTSGRIWRSVDWRPAHLHLIYEVYENRIVDRQLSGELGGRMPTLVRQF